MSDEIDLWSCEEDDEQLIFEDQDEAIQARVDDMYPSDILDALDRGHIYVYGFKRVTKEEVTVGYSVLEWLLENLDEEYGSPHDDTKPTEKMMEAERAFVNAVKEEYSPWVCRKVKSVKIDIREWLTKNDPGVLNEAIEKE